MGGWSWRSRTIRRAPFDALDRAFEQIHRRRAHEIGDEEIGRRIVDLGGRADLLQLAILQDGDLGRKRHRLDLIVRDIDDRRSGLLVQPLDLDAHVDAQLGVEIGQRLVEQEHAAAGARVRGPWRRAGAGRPKAGSDAGSRRCSICSVLATAATAFSRSGFGTPRISMPNAMFSPTVMFGIERVGLEHHRDVALRRVQVVDDAGRRSGSRRTLIDSRPAIVLSSVDLPQPDGPTSTRKPPLLERRCRCP